MTAFDPAVGAPGIRAGVDWGELAPLRLRARQVADGLYAGAHRSIRRGAGVEFGGYREYVPGDDLRWLDRRSLLRHDRLVVRQFETETDRVVCLLVDASASMGFRGPRARSTKLAFASLLAAALARVALAGGDPVSLTFLGGTEGGGRGQRRGGTGPRPAPDVPRSSGHEQFERIVGALESVQPGGDTQVDRAMLDRSLHRLARSTRRGAVVVVLSDLLDLVDGAAERVSALATGGRALCVVQTLDPAEVDFPFRGTVRLRALEGGAVVETDAETARPRYLQALAGLTAAWRDAVVARRGGRLVAARTSDDPVRAVREVVESLR